MFLFRIMLPWREDEHAPIGDGIEEESGHLERKAAHVTEFAVLATLLWLRLGPEIPRRGGRTLGLSALTAAVDETIQIFSHRGACVIEKHLTLDRTMEGPDHPASTEPEEFADMVRQIRRVEAALGDGVKRPNASEQAIAGSVLRPAERIRIPRWSS